MQKKEFDAGKIRYVSSVLADLETALYEVLEECSFLDENERTATTLLIYADGFETFYDFLDLLEKANALLSLEGYEGKYQIASFHPDYVFADTEESDAANATNRSPYPTLHLIREADMEEAIQNYPHPEEIPLRNQERCQRLGIKAIQKLYQ